MEQCQNTIAGLNDFIYREKCNVRRCCNSRDRKHRNEHTGHAHTFAQIKRDWLFHGSLVILAKLVKKVRYSFSVNFYKCILWSESPIVLGWFKIVPSRLKTFLGNIISDIQTLTETDNWWHVQSEQNSGIQGIQSMLLENNELWLYGPPWLIEDLPLWLTKQFFKSDSLLEMK